MCLGRKYGSNTGWTDEQRIGFDEATIKRLEAGSKLVLLGWFGYISALWSLKASMLYFYDRVTYSCQSAFLLFHLIGADQL
jgi:hypothetical protein